MKRFQFTLQALLTLRQRAEQQAQEKYASALLSRQRALDQLEALRQEQQQAWARWREDLSSGSSAGQLAQWQECDRKLSTRRQTAEVALGHAEIAVNQALHSMLVARRNREAADTFREHQRANYNRELLREEQKRLDELAQRRLPSILSFSTAQPPVL